MNIDKMNGGLRFLLEKYCPGSRASIAADPAAARRSALERAPSLCSRGGWNGGLPN